MFASDRELRKPPPRKGRPAPSPSSSAAASLAATSTTTALSAAKGGHIDTKDDLIEKSKMEREQRELNRVKLAHVVKIQSIIRQWLYFKKLQVKLKADIFKKLTDVENVVTVLKATKNINFTPPLNIILTMTNELLYVSHRSSAVVSNEVCQIMAFKDINRPYLCM